MKDMKRELKMTPCTNTISIRLRPTARREKRPGIFEDAVGER
jgi:hypothetical protein